METKATLKDVARLSGVSIGTVDRVLHKRGRASEEAKKAVEEAVKELNYMPSQIARALVNQKLNIAIGISILEADNTFWMESMNGILRAKDNLALCGVDIIVDRFEEVSKEAQIASVKRLLAQNVNALLLTPVETKETWIDDIVPQKIPFATVIDDLSRSRKLFHIGPDDYAMGAVMAKLSLLYTKEEICVAVLAPNANVYGTQQRIAGFRNMLEENGKSEGLKAVYEIVGDTEKSFYEATYNAAEKILQNYSEVNAIYVTNGATQWVAAAVKSAKAAQKVFVFGHECTALTKCFLKSGHITATIYQKPELQWDTAINIMKDYLLEGALPEEKNQKAECTILTKELLPLTSII